MAHYEKWVQKHAPEQSGVIAAMDPRLVLVELNRPEPKIAADHIL
jgi:hypothetical protein